MRTLASLPVCILFVLAVSAQSLEDCVVPGVLTEEDCLFFSRSDSPPEAQPRIDRIWISVKRPLTLDQVKAVVCTLFPKNQGPDMFSVDLYLGLSFKDVFFGVLKAANGAIARFHWNVNPDLEPRLVVYRDDEGRPVDGGRRLPFDPLRDCPATEDGQAAPSAGGQHYWRVLDRVLPMVIQPKRRRLGRRPFPSRSDPELRVVIQ